MTPFRWIVPVAMTLLLAACHTGEPTLNASSQQTLERTFESVVESLPAREREPFVQAFSVVYASLALEHLGQEATQAELRQAMEQTPDEVGKWFKGDQTRALASYH